MRKGEKRKQEILDTARVLFSQKGYVNTSIQDILDLLGCSKGSFYHHFKTKFEVLADIARERANQALLTYQSMLPVEAMQAFNSLLRHAAYLTREDLPLLEDLIALKAEFDGAALLSVMQEAVTEVFYPSFALLLNNLRKADKAVFLNDCALKLAFAAFLSGSALLIFETGDDAQGSVNGRLSLLRSLRKQTEVTLGLAPGSVYILEYDELNEMKRALSAAQDGKNPANLRTT